MSEPTSIPSGPAQAQRRSLQERTAAVEADTDEERDAKLRFAVRAHPAYWWENFGCIVDKQRTYRSAKRGTASQANEMQLLIISIYRYCRKHRLPCRIIVLKPRQKGASTISTALTYHDLRNFRHKGCIIGDEYEKSVKNLVDMFNLYAAEDDFPWGNHYTETNGRFSHGSELVTETANDPRAGASGTLQTLLCTEVAHWKKAGAATADAVLLSIENCLPDEPDTLEIIESTPNGIGGAYYDRWQGAVDFEDFKRGVRGNGFVRVFKAWFDFADSQVDLTPAEETAILTSLDREELLLQQRHSLTARQLAWRRNTVDRKCGGDPDKFKQEYPSDPISCFLGSGRQRFNPDGLEAWAQLARKYPPKAGVLSAPNVGTSLTTVQRPTFVQTRGEEAYLHLWEEPKPGRAHVLICDPMRGAEQTAGSKKEPDCHSVGVLRQGYHDAHSGIWNRPRLAARIAPPCRLDLDVLADIIADLSRYYGHCLVVVESNAHGIALIELLKALHPDIPLYQQKLVNMRESKVTKRLGFQNVDHREAGQLAGIRTAIIEGLASAIREYDNPAGGLDVCCPHAVQECTTFVVDANGRAAAMAGYHDDDVLMLAIGLYCLGEATTYPETVVQRVMPADLRRQLEGDGGQWDGGGQYS